MDNRNATAAGNECQQAKARAWKFTLLPKKGADVRLLFTTHQIPATNFPAFSQTYFGHRTISIVS